MKISVSWMWKTDVYNDMYNHGTLVGLSVHYIPYLEMCGQVNLRTIYLYIGFGLFYIRLKKVFKPTPKELELERFYNIEAE